MFGRNPDRTGSEQMRAIRDAALRESHPYNDPHANYPTAEWYRRTRAEGVALAHEGVA
jgi:hypothetical protein